MSGGIMTVLGFSAGATGHEGNVDRMMKAVLERSGRQSEFVKLTDLNYSACKGCVALCAGPQVCRLEDDRFWGFRHVSIAIQNKPFILVLCHLFDVEDAVADFHKVLRSYRVNVIDVITYSTESPPCYSCGHHHECRIGGLYRMRGEEGRSLKVTPELFCRWEDHPETVAKIDAAAERLNNL